MSTSKNTLTLERVREGLSDLSLRSTDFRSDLTLIADPKDVHRVLRFLRDDPDCNFDLLSDVTAVDYLDYPAQTLGRFAVVWILVCTETSARVRVKSFVDPSIDTSGIEEDPALYFDTSTDIWEGAEWREREIFDMDNPEREADSTTTTTHTLDLKPQTWKEYKNRKKRLA